MVLERILEALTANTAALNANTASRASGAAPAALAPIPALVAGGPAAAVSAVLADVTPEQLMALIQPHLGNEPVKLALGVAMRNLGISGLPEVRVDQLPTVYAAFQAVLTQFGIGALSAAPAAAAPASII